MENTLHRVTHEDCTNYNVVTLAEQIEKFLEANGGHF
jgi:hypothetical protein